MTSAILGKVDAPLHFSQMYLDQLRSTLLLPFG